MYQVEEYINHLASKEVEMAALTKTISQIQGELKNLKSKLNQAVQTGKGAEKTHK